MISRGLGLFVAAGAIVCFAGGCASIRAATHGAFASSDSASVAQPAQASPLALATDSLPARLRIKTSMKFEGAHGGERKISSSDLFEQGRWQLISGSQSVTGRPMNVMILGRLSEVIGETIKMEYLILDGSHPGVIVSDPTLVAKSGGATMGIENKKTGKITVSFSRLGDDASEAQTVRQ